MSPSADSLEITSTANPRIKATAALRDRRERESSGLTLVDGAREIRRALAAHVEFVDLFACVDLIRSEDAAAALDEAKAAGQPVTAVSRTVLEKLAFGDRSDGLVAVIRPPETTLEGLPLPAVPLIVVVESVEKPGNLGAILRSADGAGADALIAADPRTDVFNPNAIRASLGTIFSVPIAIATTAETIAWLGAAGITVVVARVDGAVAYTAADLRGPVALVLGSEAHGVADAWSDPAMTAVSLPMLGIADSLNVSAAAAILLYEARRQRTSSQASRRVPSVSP
jgi:TrmH family RNA methyltransferase